MDLIYWLMIRDKDGNIVNIQEAGWTYFYNNSGDFRSKIKKEIHGLLDRGESYEFALKSNFEKRGIINAHPEED